MQKSYLTPESFSKKWKDLILKLSQIGGLIADGVKEAMARREAHLLDNGTLVTTIWGGPKQNNAIRESAHQQKDCHTCFK